MKNETTAAKETADVALQAAWDARIDGRLTWPEELALWIVAFDAAQVADCP